MLSAIICIWLSFSYVYVVCMWFAVTVLPKFLLVSTLKNLMKESTSVPHLMDLKLTVCVQH